ncbi:hypothetical protein GEMRC1_007360 [Eukaryota sp. GEM-RC1]
MTFLGKGRKVRGASDQIAELCREFPNFSRGDVEAEFEAHGDMQITRQKLSLRATIGGGRNQSNTGSARPTSPSFPSTTPPSSSVVNSQDASVDNGEESDDFVEPSPSFQQNATNEFDDDLDDPFVENPPTDDSGDESDTPFVDPPIDEADFPPADEHAVIHTICSQTLVNGLYTDPLFSDVTLIYLDNSYPVHRSVIASQSSLMCSLFKENPSCTEFDLKEHLDVDPQVFEGIIRSLYGFSFQIDVDNCYQVYYASSILNIVPLKEKSMKSLILYIIDAEYFVKTLIEAQDRNKLCHIEEIRAYFANTHHDDADFNLYSSIQGIWLIEPKVLLPESIEVLAGLGRINNEINYFGLRSIVESHVANKGQWTAAFFKDLLYKFDIQNLAKATINEILFEPLDKELPEVAKDFLYDRMRHLVCDGEPTKFTSRK